MREQPKVRKAFFYKNYTTDFLKKQPAVVKRKIEWVFMVLETIENVPKQLLKHLSGTDGLYEIRV